MSYRHWPPQGDRVGEEQNSVWVQTSLVPHGVDVPPTMQGVTGGRTTGVTQRPPHVAVGVQVDCAGQSPAPRVHEEKAGGEDRTRRGAKARREVINRDAIFLFLVSRNYESKTQRCNDVNVVKMKNR